MSGRCGAQLKSRTISKIEFRDVTFHYPARADLDIFSNLSLDVKASSTTAIVGSSGTGKSTLLLLLQRFYDPQKGSILIDGRPIVDFNVQWLRRYLLGYVSQDTMLFGSMTIYDNIKMGIASEALTVSKKIGKHVMDDESDPIVEAARKAYAHDFIMSLPDGYDTLIGEGGSKLSGGQRQRLSIARAILKNSPVLLLDEATASLDASSEHLVQQALSNYRYDDTNHSTQKPTLIVVAHRLSTVKDADTIVVLGRSSVKAIDGNGSGCQVLEQGTHTSLMNQDSSVYKQLVMLQMDGSKASMASTRDLSIDKGVGLVNSIVESPAGSQLIEEKVSENVDSIEDREYTRNRPKEIDEIDEEKGASIQHPNFYSFMFRIFMMSRPEWIYYFTGFVASAVLGSVFPLLGLAFANIMTVLFDTNIAELQKSASFWALMFVAIASATLISSTIKETSFGIIAGKLSTRIRSLMFNAAISQEIGWHDSDGNSSGMVASRLATDAETVATFIQVIVGMIIENLVTLTVGFTLAFVYSWQLSLVMIGIIPLFILSGYLRYQSYRGYAQRTKLLYEAANELAIDATANIRSVASYTLESFMTNEYALLMEYPLIQARRASIASGICYGMTNLLQTAPLALAFYVAAIFVGNGILDFKETLIVIFGTVCFAKK